MERYSLLDRKNCTYKHPVMEHLAGHLCDRSVRIRTLRTTRAYFVNVNSFVSYLIFVKIKPPVQQWENISFQYLATEVIKPFGG